MAMLGETDPVGCEVVEHLPITQRVDGMIDGANGTSVGGLLPQGSPGQLIVSTFQIRMGFSHPTTLTVGRMTRIVKVAAGRQ